MQGVSVWKRRDSETRRAHLFEQRQHSRPALRAVVERKDDRRDRVRRGVHAPRRRDGLGIGTTAEQEEEGDGDGDGGADGNRREDRAACLLLQEAEEMMGAVHREGVGASGPRGMRADSALA